MKQRARTIRFVLTSKIENVSLVGLAVRGICSSIHLDPVTVFQIELAVTEAVTNVLEHAYESQEGHEVEVSVSLYSDRIVFQVCDEGTRLGTEKVPCLDFKPDIREELPEGGMGVHIIHTIMDEVEYTTCGGRNILTMAKSLGDRGSTPGMEHGGE